MTALKPHGGIRVLCLREGGESRTPLPDLLSPIPKLQFLGSFDIAPAPYDGVRSLRPDVVIVQLPMSQMNLIRWVNYLRTGLNDCAIVVTGPKDAPQRRKGRGAYGADEFIPENQLRRRLVQRIEALHKKHLPLSAAWRSGPRVA